MIKIPAIDLINGTCVRLTKGEFDKSTKYNTNPIEIAKKYEDFGATQIHIVDLDAARGIGSNKKIIFDIRKETSLKIQIGGGIKSSNQIDEFLGRGIEAVILGSVAIRERDLVKKWISDYAQGRIIIGADVRNNKIAIDGWLNTSEEDITEFIQDYSSVGANTFLCTDIQKDGTLKGTSNLLYNKLKLKFPDIKVIASGGVSDISDIKLLEDMGMFAVVIGKALFENRIGLEELFPKTSGQW